MMYLIIQSFLKLDFMLIKQAGNKCFKNTHQREVQEGEDIRILKADLRCCMAETNNNIVKQSFSN